MRSSFRSAARSLMMGWAWVSAAILLAQTTRVTGRVIDGATGEPLPFVNVGFQDTPHQHEYGLRWLVQPRFILRH
jgi:hypothetical protein